MEVGREATRDVHEGPVGGCTVSHPTACSGQCDRSAEERAGALKYLVHVSAKVRHRHLWKSAAW